MSAHYNNTEIYKMICHNPAVGFKWDRLDETSRDIFLNMSHTLDLVYHSQYPLCTCFTWVIPIDPLHVLRS